MSSSTVSTAFSHPLRVLFLDFDSFFASVEQALDPSLRGQPVAVVPVMSDSTCCIAASYQAKRFGIRTGTNVGEARRRCPDLILRPAQHEHYVEYHHRLIEAVETCAPVGEVCSIDELWCSLDQRQRDPVQATRLARAIKAAIARKVSPILTCSVGIAANVYLAKLASDMQKPDGLTLLPAAEIAERLRQLKLRDFCGIGPQMEQRLLRHGIVTVEALLATSRVQMKRIWGGIEGERFYDQLRGAEVWRPRHERASISHSHVLPPALRNDADAYAVLHRLLQKAAVRLRAQQLATGCLSIALDYLRSPGWSTKQRIEPTQDSLQLARHFQQLWQQRPADGSRLLRVGLGFSELVPGDRLNGSLFSPPREQLWASIDALNARYGKHTVYLGGAHETLNEAPMRIAFSRIPDPALEA